MKLGIIGLGNMSSAIVEGLQSSNTFDMSSIYASGRNLDKLSTLCNKLGINACKDNEALIESSDIIMLGVKPEQLKELSESIRPLLKDKPIISIAAKTSFNTLQDLFGPRPYIRIMPNLNVAIRKGMSAIAYLNTSTTMESYIDNLFSTIGGIVHIPESQFSGFIGLAGSSPAFIFRLINEIAKIGVEEGFTLEQSLEIVSKAVEGSSLYLRESSDAPETLIMKVTSKGGTTYEGLKVMDEEDFDTIIHKTIRATIQKDKKG